MAKESISITLDCNLKNTLGIVAKQENRTISNLLELIATEYLQKKREELELKQSFERAKIFASKLEIRDYITSQTELEKNVNLTDKDIAFLNRK